MKQPGAEELFEKYKNGTLSPEERSLLEAWYIDFAQSAKPLQDPVNFLNALEDMDAAAMLKPEPLVRKVLWKRFAAAALIVVVAGSLLHTHHFNREVEEVIVIQKDIPPGKNTATLTLENGQKIRLNAVTKGLIVAQHGITVTKAADGKLVYTTKDKHAKSGQTTGYHTISTANGEQYQVNLPDGTKVWLNAASSLKFSVTFSQHKTRQVELTGEAYFEVARDKNHPFLVQSRSQQVHVVGTHFDINTYADEPSVKTTLLEGVIILSHGNGTDGQTENVILKPGQQASVRQGEAVRLSNVDVESVVDWKNGDFIFKGGDFKASMRKIARWYNVDLVYDTDVRTQVVLGGWLSRKNNLSTILDRIESTANVHFKVEGRRITVTK